LIRCADGSRARGGALVRKDTGQRRRIQRPLGALDKSGFATQLVYMKHRTLIMAAVGAFLVIAVIALLGFAHAFAILEDGKRCFPGFFHAQWPKWIGCAMAAHENLAGGLIGGALTLLAAFIAAEAVWQQIEDARKQVKLADERRATLEYY